MYNNKLLFYFLVTVNPVFGWQFFTNFRDLTMSGTGLEASKYDYPQLPNDAQCTMNSFCDIETSKCKKY